VEALAAELGAGYFRRPDNKGFKAGNVNHALKFTDGDLIAFFDADHVPVRSFLKRTVGFFLEDQKVALVQTPHHFYNPDPFERNLHLTGRVPSEQHLFYHGIQLGNDFWNSAFFCGSCAVIRRSAMVEVGGMSEETVTEDAHTAMKMHSRGWRSVYLDVPLAAGLATESYAVHVKQRTRWARGMAQIFRKDNPLLKPGLSLAQRLNYFNASWHFFFGVPRLIFMIMPSLYLVFDFHPLSADVREVLVYAIPHLVLAGLGAASINRNVRHSFWPEVYELAVAPYAALVTAWAVVSPESGAFNPTAKGGTESGYRFDWRRTWFLLLVVAMVVAGLIYTPFKISAHPFEQDTIIVAAVWNFYNLVILSAAISAAYESPQKRKHHRVSRPARVILKSDPRLPEPITAHRAEPTGEAINLSMGGAAFRVPGRVVVPDTFGLQIESPYGRTPTLPCDRIESIFQGDHTVIRCSFAHEMGGERQRELTLQIFSASDSWVHDRYSYDRPLISLKNVLLAPFSAFLQAPGWVQSAMTPSARAMGPLVPGAVASRCASCGAPLAPSERECEACGAVVAEVDEFAMMAQTGPQLPAPLNLQPAARGRFWVVVPARLVIFAVALGAGYSPVVAALSRYMPLQKWERVTHRTRGHELNLAYEQLRLLEAELISASQGASLALDWRSRLWGIRRDFHLYGNDPSRPDLDGVAGHLDQSVRFMDSAEEELRRGLSPDVIRPRLETVDQKLDLVAELRGLPR
jgi:cellulose synthase (UDP-forming)